MLACAGASGDCEEIEKFKQEAKEMQDVVDVAFVALKGNEISKVRPLACSRWLSDQLIIGFHRQKLSKYLTVLCRFQFALLFLFCTTQAVEKFGSEVASLKEGSCELQLVLLPYGKDKDDLDEYMVRTQ